MFRAVPLHLILAVLVLLAAACGSEGEKDPPVEIHAHRGGPLGTGFGDVIAVHPENSMSAFRAAHADGFTVALDVKLTADAVPVVMHDSKLDRTTDCRGRVDARTAQSLARCRLDFLGTNGVTRPNLSPERIPTLAQALEWARAKGAELTVEIEDVPARPVVDALASSGIDGEQLLVKSFRIRDLQIARDAAWRTALLTDHDDNAAAPGIASREDVDVLSPQWPLPDGFLDEAGRPVVPWTLNSARQIEAAVRAGVDGIVTDNPAVAGDVIDAG